jgi:hypothetical protein
MLEEGRGKRETARGRAPLIPIPLCDSDSVANAEPTPVFRRFPWIQFVFCLACLSMTAWAWMRYSYAWDMTPDDMWLKVDGTRGPPHSFWI